MDKLETERLILRGWVEEDLRDFFELYKSDDVKNAGADVCTDMDTSFNNLKNTIINAETWCITLKPDNIVIGTISLSDINRHDKYKEVEYIISEKHQNKGYATEAVKRLIDYGFEELDLLVIVACHYPSNIKSSKVIEKSGLIYEGTLRKYSRNLEDSVRYSITKEDWEQKNT